MSRAKRHDDKTLVVGRQFPGCSHTRHLHAHHLQSWLYGGRTDVDNLILMLVHHRLIDDHGYRIRRQFGRWEFCRPDGTSIPTVGAVLTGNVESLIELGPGCGSTAPR